MKQFFIVLLIICNFSCAQEKKTDENKKIVLGICDEFTKRYSKNNSFQQNQMMYTKNVEFKLLSYDSIRKDKILRKLHESCPSLLEYSTLASRKKVANEGRPNAYKLWDIFINSKNDISWTENERKKFLDVCNYALSKKKNTKRLCDCTIDKISEKLSAKYFHSLSINEQGYLSGQVGYVYCSEINE